MTGRREIEILYEDDFMIVIDKPCGLLTMSTGREGEITAYSILTDYVRHGTRQKKNRGKRDRERIFIVHRLDRDTSGAIVFAKDPETKYALQDSWNETVLERKYVAVLEGVPEIPEGTVESWLTDNPKSHKVSSCPYDNGGRYSVTHYRLLRPGTAERRHHSAHPERHMTQTVRDTVAVTDSVAGKRNTGYALVEFELETGRKNQIRVHAAEIGHPVAGDRKYGAATNPLHRLCLHARTLTLKHPVTGEILSFDTGIPGSFLKII